MASGCHIGVGDGGFSDGFRDNFMQKGVKSVFGRINPIICVVLVFSSYLHVGAFSN